MDASALLCWLYQEPGAEAVARFIEAGPAMSAANLAEVVCKLGDRNIPAEDIDRILEGLPVQVVDLDLTVARRMHRLREAGRPLGLSLGDLACIATGVVTGARIVTADGAWRRLPRRIAAMTDFVR